MVVPLFVGVRSSIQALEDAMAATASFCSGAQREAGEDEPVSRGHLHHRHARYDHPAAAASGRHRQGAGRGQDARADSIASRPIEPYFVRSSEISGEGEGSVEGEALVRTVHSTFENYVKLNKKVPPEMLNSVQAIQDRAGSRTPSSRTST